MVYRRAGKIFGKHFPIYLQNILQDAPSRSQKHFLKRLRTILLNCSIHFGEEKIGLSFRCNSKCPQDILIVLLKYFLRRRQRY